MRKLMSGMSKKLAFRAFFLLTAMAVALGSTTYVHAQFGAEEEMKKVVVVSISGYDDLVADIDFLGGLAGKPDASDSLDQLLKMFTQGKGLAGLDKSKPWGAVLHTDGIQFQPMAFVAVTDLTELLDALALFQIEAVELEDGVTELESPTIPKSLFVKEQGGWAFIARSAAALEQLPADPIELLDGLNEHYDIAVRAYIQNIPELFRQMAIKQLQAGVQQGLNQLNSDQDQAEQLAEGQLRATTRLIEETDHFTIGWLIDSQEQKTHLDFSFVALQGSHLARQAAALRDTTSAFTGFLHPDAAVKLNFSSKYPEEEAQQVAVMLEALRNRALQSIDEEADLPTDADRDTLKSALNQVIDVFKDTVEGGTMDGGAALKLEQESVTFVVGAYLVGADRLEDVLKQLAELSEGKPEFPEIQWDADSHLGIQFHTARVPIPEEERDTRKILGDELDIVVGIGQDSFYVGVGEDSLSTLKAVIDQSKAGADMVVTPMMFSISLGKLMNFVASQVDNPRIDRIAELLDQSAGNDHVNIAVRVIENGFFYRIEIEEGVLKAIGKAVPAAETMGF